MRFSIISEIPGRTRLQLAGPVPESDLESIHAGLECGLFAEALHGLDAIAVGPTLSDVHTPDESMELASAERFYELLIDVLKRLAA